MDFFLSAGIPDERRSGGYHKTADVVGIRDAVRAIGLIVATSHRVVFGGHPAITPVLSIIVKSFGLSDKDQIVLYQSKFFEREFIDENKSFAKLVECPAGKDRAESLKIMREKMFSDFVYAGAFFVGGMEGVEEEFRLFKEACPSTECFPFFATGGAARNIFIENYNNPEFDWLKDRTFMSLCRLAVSQVELKQTPTMRMS